MAATVVVVLAVNGDIVGFGVVLTLVVGEVVVVVSVLLVVEVVISKPDSSSKLHS